MKDNLILLDCTLRDGGYYNNWDFNLDRVREYLQAMSVAKVDIVELGLRSLSKKGFKGAFAYTTDEYLESLDIPSSLTVSVMVNASDLLSGESIDDVLESLFPLESSNSKVKLVRVACHVHEFVEVLPAAAWLKAKNFMVGFNLMQVGNCNEEAIKALARSAELNNIDVLYFADSLGGMKPARVKIIISWLRSEWHGPLGIHTHDNMGLALSNTLCALDEGVTWVDATVTGMGRGPGNARTEEVVIELAERRKQTVALVPMMELISSYFKPMQNKFGWGTNIYYYLAGKYGIHPTYIQEMLGDKRYSNEDVLAVIERLKVDGGNKYSAQRLDVARHFYLNVNDNGKWSPREIFSGRDVLILGAGPGAKEHQTAIEIFIKKSRPLVIALNTQSPINPGLIDYRAACHPVRLLADCSSYNDLVQPLITPFSILPDVVQSSLNQEKTLDFGMKILHGQFSFGSHNCTLPISLVVAYALAIATSGNAENILLAGFDGYMSDDPRSKEMQDLLDLYIGHADAAPLHAITPTRYDVPLLSVYAL